MCGDDTDGGGFRCWQGRGTFHEDANAFFESENDFGAERRNPASRGREVRMQGEPGALDCWRL